MSADCSESVPEPQSSSGKRGRQDQSITSLSYAGQSAGGDARQHNGNVYNNNTYNYTQSQRRADGNLFDAQRSNALLDAAASGQTSRVKYLLESGADIDHKDKDEMTALHHAVLSGFEDCVQVLLDAHADVNASGHECGTPLCLAVGKRRARVARLLLEYRANGEAPGGCFGSALHIACARNDVALLNLLLERCPRLNMRRIVSQRQWPKYFVDSMGAAFDQRLPAPIDAMAFGQPLLGNCPHFECEPLFCAALEGSESVIPSLLLQGASVGAIAYANFRPDEAHLNEDGLQRVLFTSLMAASLRGHADSVRIFLQASADVRFPGGDSLTPLH